MTYHLTNYEFKIGLEIHIELKTTLKMFSNSLSMSEFLDKYQIFLPNLFVDEVDLGYPGSLPVVNYHAVKLGYVLAHLLKMDYKPILYFDRKNYFYYDLPKGYQITQFYKPLAINGTMLISNKQQQPKTIKITEIHLEEDTAKNLKSATHIKLDYNRCGIPLIEIVTAPDFVDADEVIDFLKRLTNLLNYYGISDAQMHRGSLRCDVNISINKVHELTLGNRIEIKNLNSYESIKMAIAFEMNQQFNAVTNNEVIMSATKTYLPATKATLFLRNKTTVDGYHYMPEINLPPIHVPASLISETKQFVTHHQMFIDHTNVNYEQIFAETYQLPLTMANVLINNHALLNIFYHTIHLPTLSLLIGH